LTIRREGKSVPEVDVSPRNSCEQPKFLHVPDLHCRLACHGHTSNVRRKADSRHASRVCRKSQLPAGQIPETPVPVLKRHTTPDSQPPAIRRKGTATRFVGVLNSLKKPADFQ